MNFLILLLVFFVSRHEYTSDVTARGVVNLVAVALIVYGHWAIKVITVIVALYEKRLYHLLCWNFVEWRLRRLYRLTCKFERHRRWVARTYFNGNWFLSLLYVLMYQTGLATRRELLFGIYGDDHSIPIMFFNHALARLREYNVPTDPFIANNSVSYIVYGVAEYVRLIIVMFVRIVRRIWLTYYRDWYFQSEFEYMTYIVEESTLPYVMLHLPFVIVALCGDIWLKITVRIFHRTDPNWWMHRIAFRMVLWFIDHRYAIRGELLDNWIDRCVERPVFLFRFYVLSRIVIWRNRRMYERQFAQLGALDECAVCLDINVRHYVILRCDHRFCVRCVGLLVNPTCPMCRAQI